MAIIMKVSTDSKDSKDLKCFNDGSGSIEIMSVTNGTAPYNYNWTGPNGYSETTSSSNITSLEAGVYVIKAIGTDGTIYTSKLIKD